MLAVPLHEKGQDVIRNEATEKERIRAVVEKYQAAQCAGDWGRCWDLWCRQDQQRRSREHNIEVYESTPEGGDDNPPATLVSIEIRGAKAVATMSQLQLRAKDIAGVYRTLNETRPGWTPEDAEAEFAQLPRVPTEIRLYLRREAGRWRVYRGIGEPPPNEVFWSTDRR